TTGENASYPLSICAARPRLLSAISQGHRPGDLESLTVPVDADKPSSPCVAFRQLLKELFDDHLPVHLTNHKGDLVMLTVAESL
ncbi:cytidine deaminase, partial [Staphylococcus aureus]